MILIYTSAGEETRIEVSDERDWTEVCNAVRARLFPGIEIPARDERFEAVMAKRRAEEKT